MKLSNAIPALATLAHSGRLKLFRLLVQAGDDGLAAGELARLAQVNLTTSSAQLSILSHAALVRKQRSGRSIIYRANYDQISKLLRFLMQDCCAGRDEILQPLANLTASTQANGETK